MILCNSLNYKLDKVVLTQMLNDHKKVLHNFEIHHLGLIHEVGSFGMTFKALRQHILKPFANEI